MEDIDPIRIGFVLGTKDRSTLSDYTAQTVCPHQGIFPIAADIPMLHVAIGRVAKKKEEASATCEIRYLLRK